MNLERRFDADELAAGVADRLVELAARAIEERDIFSLVLCGGGTPLRLFGLLASPARKAQVDWSRVEVYWGDERSVPPDHPESNYRMAHEAFLEAVAVPPRQIHRIRGELPPEEAARDYAQRLGEPWPRFDCVLLGLGGDGHTASLFPGSATGESGDPLAAVEAEYDGRPAWRVTMTPVLLNEARQVIFLVSGQGKTKALRGSLGPSDPKRFPAQRIALRSGRVEWWVDEAAWGGP